MTDLLVAGFAHSRRPGDGSAAIEACAVEVQRDLSEHAKQNRDSAAKILATLERSVWQSPELGRLRGTAALGAQVFVDSIFARAIEGLHNEAVRADHHRVLVVGSVVTIIWALSFLFGWTGGLVAGVLVVAYTLWVLLREPPGFEALVRKYRDRLNADLVQSLAV